MVYSNKFVMAVMINGVPQKELANGVVPIPFGAEYYLRFRNKNDRRAVVKFFIDGENVSGEGYVVNANSYTDIKRHASIDRAFKFVSLESAEAVDFGKNGGNEDKVKGVIEARFYLEKETPKVTEVHHYHHSIIPRPLIRRSIYPNSGKWAGGGNEEIYTKGFCSTGNYRSSSNEVLGFAATESSTASPSSISHSLERTLQDGCTVEGNISGQQFHTVHIEYETDYVAVKIFLQGFEPVAHALPLTGVNYSQLKGFDVLNEQNPIADLEKQNADLRRKIAELENEKLRKQLEALQS